MRSRDYIILTDTGSDLPKKYAKTNQIALLPISYQLDNIVYDDQETPYQPVHEFYEQVRGGKMPTTSQINLIQAKEAFSAYLEQDKDILCIGFSSGLSGTCQNYQLAADELNQQYGEERIVVVDSLSASLGQGLLVYHASQKKKAGMSLDELAGWVRENRLHICHNFTVDDLNHLYRGGRVNKATALFGTMLNIKPVLHVDDEGHLVAIGKARGRKASLDALVDNMSSRITGYTNSICMISHGDCLSEAEYVADAVRKRFGISEFLISEIGPVIGTHSGPGTVALFFLGDHR